MTTTNDIQPASTDLSDLSHLSDLIVAIYRDTMLQDDLGPDSDFYEAGGDSMTAFQIIARLRDALGVDVPIALVFACPTPADLAAAIPGLADGEAGDGFGVN
jgi:acyl carrier protein